jgi:hypothetical protein
MTPTLSKRPSVTSNDNCHEEVALGKRKREAAEDDDKGDFPGEEDAPGDSFDHDEEDGGESDAREEPEAHDGCSFDISLIANLGSLYLKDLLSDEAHIIPQEPTAALRDCREPCASQEEPLGEADWEM